MDNWKNNSIQFPRLIEEAQAAGAFTDEVIDAMCESMNLEKSELFELMERARIEWERIKNKWTLTNKLPNHKLYVGLSGG